MTVSWLIVPQCEAPRPIGSLPAPPTPAGPTQHPLAMPCSLGPTLPEAPFPPLAPAWPVAPRLLTCPTLSCPSRLSSQASALLRKVPLNSALLCCAAAPPLVSPVTTRAETASHLRDLRPSVTPQKCETQSGVFTGKLIHSSVAPRREVCFSA